MEMTPRQLRNLRGVAQKWLEGRITDEAVEDLVQDAVIEALKTWDTVVDLTWEQHCVFHVITAARGQLLSIQRGETSRTVPLDSLPIDVQDELMAIAEEDRVGQNGEEREDRYQACYQVLDRLTAKHKNVLVTVYAYGVSLRDYAEFLHVSKSTVHGWLIEARKQFVGVARELGLINDSDLGVFARLVEDGRTWTGKCLEQSERPGGVGSKKKEKPPVAFYDINQQLCHVSNQREELKKRCQRLRTERSHSPVVSTPTPVLGQIYSPS